MKKNLAPILGSSLAVVILISMSLTIITHKGPLYRLNQLRVNYQLDRAFHDYLTQSRQTRLDLREVKVVEWDELVLWLPYKNICDYGISEFSSSSNSNNCEQSMDDGETYLLFLRANHLMGRVKINRQQFDVATSSLPTRIKKSQAIFYFHTKGHWPKVQLGEK